MTSKRIIGFGLLGALGIAILAALIEPGNEGAAQVMYTIGGLGMFVFGIWAAVTLLSKKG